MPVHEWLEGPGKGIAMQLGTGHPRTAGHLLHVRAMEPEKVEVNELVGQPLILLHHFRYRARPDAVLLFQLLHQLADRAGSGSFNERKFEELLPDILFLALADGQPPAAADHEIVEPPLADLLCFFFDGQRFLAAAGKSPAMRTEKAVGTAWRWLADHSAKIHDGLVVCAGLTGRQDLLRQRGKIFFSFRGID